jgi:hypothetical protein
MPEIGKMTSEPEVTQEMREAGKRAELDWLTTRPEYRPDSRVETIYRAMHKARPHEWSVPVNYVLVRNDDGDLVVKAVEEKPAGLPPMAGKGVIDRISCAIQDAMRSARTPSKGYAAAALVAYQIAEVATHEARTRAKRLREMTQVVNALHGETLRALSDGPAPPEKSET